MYYKPIHKLQYLLFRSLYKQYCKNYKLKKVLRRAIVERLPHSNPPFLSNKTIGR